MKTPYDHADKAMKTIRAEMGREFQNLSVRMPFDELNVNRVKKEVGDMYVRLGRVVRKGYRKIIREAKKDAEVIVGFPVKLDTAVLLAAVLHGYNDVTRYVYTAEWLRKRDRLVESIMAGGNRREVREALKRAVDVLYYQVQEYGDIVTDETRLEVFEAAGIDNVMWNTQRDGKVCKTCQDRDREIYPVLNVPSKHYHCRCYLTPAP